MHSVAFSPSGDILAFAGHDSSVTVVYPSAPDQAPRAIVSVSTQLLPFTSLLWSSESEIVAVGYVSIPRSFEIDCRCFFLYSSIKNI